jgi:hypothetical protein
MDEEEDLASQLGPRTSQCVSRLARVFPPRDAPAGLRSIEGLGTRRGFLRPEIARRRDRREAEPLPALTEPRVSF